MSRLETLAAQVEAIADVLMQKADRDAVPNFEQVRLFNEALHSIGSQVGAMRTELCSKADSAEVAALAGRLQEKADADRVATAEQLLDVTKELQARADVATATLRAELEALRAMADANAAVVYEQLKVLGATADAAVATVRKELEGVQQMLGKKADASIVITAEHLRIAAEAASEALKARADADAAAVQERFKDLANVCQELARLATATNSRVAHLEGSTQERFEELRSLLLHKILAPLSAVVNWWKAEDSSKPTPVLAPGSAQEDLQAEVLALDDVVLIATHAPVWQGLGTGLCPTSTAGGTSTLLKRRRGGKL